MQPIDDPAHDHEVGVRDSTQDTTRIDDVRIAAVRPLISPALLHDELPVPPAVQAL
nr:3-deoxy-7-phosphoheptulonate synthase [Caldimonas sp.]